MQYITHLVLLVGVALLSHMAIAHAPELHKKEGAEKPQCEAMSKMDPSKMDKNDPVMQAMMQQCEGWFHGDHGESEKEGKHPQKPMKDTHNHH